MKTPQEILNNVWTYFIVDKHPQATNGAQCVYRGPESNCAIGCQLPDELYDVRMEESPVRWLFKKFPKVADYFGQDNKGLLERLQAAHDDAPWIELKDRLEIIARDFELEIPAQ